MKSLGLPAPRVPRVCEPPPTQTTHRPHRTSKGPVRTSPNEQSTEQPEMPEDRPRQQCPQNPAPQMPRRSPASSQPPPCSQCPSGSTNTLLHGCCRFQKPP